MYLPAIEPGVVGAMAEIGDFSQLGPEKGFIFDTRAKVRSRTSRTLHSQCECEEDTAVSPTVQFHTQDFVEDVIRTER